METALILIVAAVLSAGVVWWASTPPGRTGPRRAPPRPITLRESFQRTGPEPLPLPEAPPQEAFSFLSQTAPDDRPPAVLSLLRIVVTIAFVALVSVGLMGLLGVMVKTQLDKYLGS